MIRSYSDPSAAERFRIIAKAVAFSLATLTLPMRLPAQHIYWGDSVPKGWNGQWPAELRTVIVLSNPRVTSPQQAKASGKNVIFLMGNIHPPEPEAAEALLLVARDLLLGKKKSLLDNQIVIIAPIFNVDGTDTFVTQDGSLGSVTPYILGVRENSQGLDLNRDGVKLNWPTPRSTTWSRRRAPDSSAGAC